jgi:AraC family transcriptional regulator, transcriptional activator of pobA
MCLNLQRLTNVAVGADIKPDSSINLKWIVMQPIRLKTISQLHQVRGLPKPEHPLISIINYKDLQHPTNTNTLHWVQDFYSVSLKHTSNIKFRYGQQQYDFDEGILFFIAPGQSFRIEVDRSVPITHTGWLLLIHPDFIWNTALAKTINQYEYFGYAVNEALFLSPKEEATINQIIRNIRQEYHTNIDRFSQNIIISQLETLFNYAERFYHRQFITRHKTNHSVLQKLEAVLSECFTDKNLLDEGVPTVANIASLLHLSPNYLSGLLKVLTGQSTQQHIHGKLIEKAKEKLSTTNLSVNEIAYQLGFEHPQSFSKLFKGKTAQSPLQFRAAFQ